jgi:CubicO group peptidase (beta-lactamase class C family)
MLLGGRYRRIRLPFALLLVCGALLADDRSEAVDRLLKPFRSDSAPGCAVGVVQNSQFVYRSAFGVTNLDANSPITTATPFHVASISKQFTAAALFFLLDAGKVRLEDSVRRFVPELPPLVQDVTIADLLHHTSGLRDVFPLLEAAGHPPQILDIAGNLKLLAAQSALNFAPGTDYEYVNSDYLLLGLIVERVSGMTLADFAEEHIFGPLGMNHSAFPGGVRQLTGTAYGYSRRGSQFHHSIPPLVAGDGGLQSSVEDLARWDENFYTQTVGGRRLIDFLEEPGHLRSGESVRYAAGLAVGKFRGLPAIGHDGILPGSRSDLVRFPMQHLTVICLCNRGDAEASSLSRMIAAIYLQGKLKHRLHQADIEYPASGFPELAGVWESKQGWILRAWSTIDGLSVTSPQGAYEMAPLNRNQMFDEAVGWRAILTRLTPDRIRLERNGGIPVIYDRLPTMTPKAAYLEAFVGDYRANDVDATWSFSAESGRLIASINGNWRIPLDAAGPDRFAGGPWSLHFQYDAEGHVRGVELHRARLWNLWFDRVDRGN